MENKISVIIPVYNGEKYLQRTLLSVLNQSFKVDEVLIINDGSEDNSKKIIFNWKKKLPIIYFENNKNMGVPFSLRRGISLSKGDIIFRLDCDDEWKKNHVKNTIFLIQNNKKSVLFASRAYYIFPKNKIVKKSKILSNKNIRKDLMWDNPIVHSTVAFRKEDYFRTIGYSNLKCAHDYSLFIELLKIGQFTFSNKLSVNYYVNENSLSRRNLKECLNDRFKNQWRALYLFNKESKIYAFKVFLILIVRKVLFI